MKKIMVISMVAILVLFATACFGGEGDSLTKQTFAVLNRFDETTKTVDVINAFDDKIGGDNGDTIARAVNASRKSGYTFEEIADSLADVPRRDQDDVDAVVKAIKNTGKTVSADPSLTPSASPGAPPAITGTGQPGAKPEWLGSQCKLAPAIPVVRESVKVSFTAADSLAYPDMVAADPNRSGKLFPDTNIYGHAPRVGYDVSFQNGDYFEDCFGDTDVPQFYWRVETTGYFWIPKSGNTPEDIVCMASEKKGCALIYVNHFGPTMKINGVYDDNGFTVAGRVWDMSTPDKVTAAAQDLVDHYVYRMIFGDNVATWNEGTNCGSIEGCNSVEWHVVLYGNGKLQKHWAGLWSR